MKKETKIILIVVIFLILWIIGVNIFFKANKNHTIQSNIYGNESFNMTSYVDNIIKYEDCIIFSKGEPVLNFTVTNFDDGIYKYNLKTGQVIKLSNYNGHNFNIIDNTLYYIDKYNDIEKFNLITQAKSRIIIDNAKAINLIVNENYLIYRDDNGKNLYMTDLNGNNKTLVAEYVESNFQIVNGFVYYVDIQSSNLLKKQMLLENASTEKIIEESISQFYVKDNYIFYLSGDTLKRYDVESNLKETIKNGVSSNFVLDSEKIYMYSNDDSSIISININDLQQNTILESETKYYRLQYFDNTLFYYTNVNSSYSRIKTLLYYYNLKEQTQEELHFATK